MVLFLNLSGLEYEEKYASKHHTVIDLNTFLTSIDLQNGGNIVNKDVPENLKKLFHRRAHDEKLIDFVSVVLKVVTLYKNRKEKNSLLDTHVKKMRKMWHEMGITTNK